MINSIAIVAALLALTPSEATFTTLDGATFSGAIDSWKGNQLAIATAGGVRKVSTESLLDAAWPREAVPSSVDRSVELIDGSRVAYASFTISKRVAEFQLSFSQQTVRIPTALIRRIELVPTNDALAATLAVIEQKQPAGDSLVVVKRDATALDYLSGVIGDVTREQADFEWDGERVPVKLAKIAAMVFFHPKQAKVADELCRVSLADGSLIAVRQAAVSGSQLRLRSGAGVELRIPLAELARIDFSAGKLAYLGDLTPSGNAWTPQVAVPDAAPTIARHGEPRINVSFGGSPLSLLWRDDPLPARRDVRTYARGIAVRSRTELTYLIPAGMSRFVATAGIDPATASQGHVLLEIRGDDRILWQGAIDGGEPPAEIDVELGAARRLHLVVDYGRNLDYGDRLHLIEARFAK